MKSWPLTLLAVIAILLILNTVVHLKNNHSIHAIQSEIVSLEESLWNSQTRVENIEKQLLVVDQLQEKITSDIKGVISIRADLEKVAQTQGIFRQEIDELKKQTLDITK